MEDFNKKESRKVLTLELKVRKTYLELVPRPSNEDYQRLKDNIARNDFDDANPIIINEEMIVLDGHTRLQIAKELGLEWVYAIVKDLADHYAEKKYIIETNLNQRHFTSKQKVEMAEKLIEIRKAEARSRQRQVGDQNLMQNKNVQESSALIQNAPGSPNIGGTGNKHNGEAMDQTARDIGVGRETLRKGLKVKEATRTDPEIAAAWEDKSTSINQIYQQVKEKENQNGEVKKRPKVVFAKVKTWKEERAEHLKRLEEEDRTCQVPREELVKTFLEAARIKQLPMDAVEALMETDHQFLQVWKDMRLGMVTLTVGWGVIYWKLHVWLRAQQGLEPDQDYRVNLAQQMRISYVVQAMQFALKLAKIAKLPEVFVSFLTGIDLKLFPLMYAWEDRLDLLAAKVRLRPRIRPEVAEKAQQLWQKGKKLEYYTYINLACMGDFNKKLLKEEEKERQRFGRI